MRQLDRVSELLLARAWSLGAGPGDRAMTIDIDSTILEVHGSQKQGAGYGYTHVLGYHPLLATRADTGETLHVRFRKGSANTQRGAQRFVRETVGRVRRAGASGALILRCDSGFFSQYVVQACRDHDVRYSITARQTPAITRAIEQIAEESWTSIDYTANGEAWVAEATYGDQHRLIVRRTKLSDPRPALFPTYRYHAFITDREGEAIFLDADHRRHAVVELAIRDLKEGSGLEHCPSGAFNANAAWAVLASIAHNLVRWVGSLGLEITGPLVTKTIRRTFLALPGRFRLGTTAIPSSADEVALSDPVERVLHATRHTTDLTTSVLRSLAARPATSSAKALRTRERSRPIAFACQPRARDAVNCDPRRHSMVESDHLCVFDGGSRLSRAHHW